MKSVPLISDILKWIAEQFLFLFNIIWLKTLFKKEGGLLHLTSNL